MADADNIEKHHESLINDSLAKNATRILNTKQVIEQYENQIKLFEELPKTLKKSVLVPIGTKGLIRGHIVHTNEVFHKVGCGYVIKRTAKQAMDYCDRMLCETNQFLLKLQQEESWLTNQLQITSRENPFVSNDCVEIIENYDEASEVEWRRKHRDSVQKWKQAEAKQRAAIQQSTSQQECFSRLDQLEILEELEQFTTNINSLNYRIEKNSKLEEVQIKNEMGEKESVCGSTRDADGYIKLRDNLEESVKRSSDDNDDDGGESEKEYTNSESIKTINESNEMEQEQEQEKEKARNSNKNVVESPEECIEGDGAGEGEGEGHNTNKKYLDFVELHKIELNKFNEKLENLHNNQKNITNSTNNHDLTTVNENHNQTQTRRKLEDLEKELENTRKTKTIIKSDEDLLKRLDELEKEENLLEEMELLTATSDVMEEPSPPPPPPPSALAPAHDDADGKKCTIRFNERVRTNYYVSTTAVSEDDVGGLVESTTTDCIHSEGDDNECKEDPVTLYIYISHTQQEQEQEHEHEHGVANNGLLKPSDIYDLPYRPKSILKNKNRLYDEPQHTGGDEQHHLEQQQQQSIHHHHHHGHHHHHHIRKKDRGRDRWVCYDTFSSKNGGGNDSDQENANDVQVPPQTPPPPPLSEVKEKSVVVSSSASSTVGSTPPPPPPPQSQPTKKRQSRFLVSRALITKK